MSYDYHEIIIILFLFFTLANSCLYTKIDNVTYGHVENYNFFLGQYQIQNRSCSWKILNRKQEVQSYYIVSLRTLKLDVDRISSSNELILKTNDKEILLSDIYQRSFHIPSLSATLEVLFRPKLHSTSLNIHRFQLEFVYINSNKYNSQDYFRCAKSGLILPKQWKCNCLYECLYNDHSDEDDCPLCSMAKTSNSLLCHSNETWCLPISDSTDKIDPNGVCIPRGQIAQCSYSSKCETILTFYKDHGEIILDNSTVSNRESLCFIIIAKENYRIKLNINRFDFLSQHPDLEFLIYDGSEEQNSLLISSDMLLMRQIIQTSENHLATIIIRKKRSKEDLNQVSIYHQHPSNNILLNITWQMSLCPSNQMLCSGHYEFKCYSAQQRCNGIWDCISGDDELGCSPSSCPTTFACNDHLILPTDQPRCYSWFDRCNGNAFCVNRIDEKNCTNWWCNSNNGTFLCKNLNCIYETWVCDGSNDCGDNSDEINCPFRISRRIMAAAVIGATICSILFILALGCTCKLVHLRSAEQRASMRLLNPQEYIQRRREELQRQPNRRSQLINNNDDDDSSDLMNVTSRIAPPSYNQTMGVSDDDEERNALLTDYLRLAGLDNFITLPIVNSTSRTSRHRNRRHRRHHRRRHHHHHHLHHHYNHHRNQNEESHVPLIESNVNSSHPSLSLSSTSRFDRFRSRFQSLFTRNLSINNNHISSNDTDAYERNSSIQPIALSNRSHIETQEPPPAYSDEPLLTIHNENDIQSSTTIPIATPAYRMRKRHMHLNRLCDHFEVQPATSSSSTSLPITTMIQEDEQASSDDDDDKLLMP